MLLSEREVLTATGRPVHPVLRQESYCNIVNVFRQPFLDPKMSVQFYTDTCVMITQGKAIYYSLCSSEPAQKRSARHFKGMGRAITLSRVQTPQTPNLGY